MWLTGGQGSGTAFEDTFVKDFLKSMFLSQPVLHEKQRPEDKHKSANLYTVRLKTQTTLKLDLNWR